ncbi:MAG: DUF58 domain-containing protein [Candidatus Acidiferrales bacterium]
MQRFLDPQVLAGISSLDLVAKTVVDGFVAGLHRSPDFGFSQEFAEYRAYTPGDDLRHVDWNLFARTERCYLKRYRGETNSQLTVMLDASNSMQYTSGPPRKMDYARYIAASLFYLAIHNQRDAAGLIVFDDEVREYIKPSTRPGQLARLFAGLEQAEPRALTNFAKPLKHLESFRHRRGIAIVISDFYEHPETIVHTIAPMRYRGNDVVLFHILDPQEVRRAMQTGHKAVHYRLRDQIQRRDTRENLRIKEPLHQLSFGRCTCAMSLFKISSASMRSDSAWKFNKMRCRNTGTTTEVMSS